MYMNQKKTRLIFTILVTAILITFIFSLVGSAFAQQTELVYPKILDGKGGASPPNEVRGLPNFIKYMFNFGIAIAGLVAFISFVYGGFRYTASAGNPGNLSDARDQIKASLLGLGLLLGSWLLLTTINPQLVVLQLSKDASQQGIVLFKGADCGETKSLQEGVGFLRVKNSLSYLTAKGFDFPQVGALLFLNSPEEIAVTLYPETDYRGTPTFRSEDLPPGADACQKVKAASGSGSVQIVWKRPGVYLFSETGCKGNAHLYGGNTATLGGADKFDNEAKSLKIIPSTTKVPVPISEKEELDRLKKSDSSKIPEPRFSTVITNKLGVILFEKERFQEDGAVFLGGKVDYIDPTKTTCVDITNACGTNQEPYCTSSSSTSIAGEASSLKIFHQYLFTKVSSGGQKIESEDPPSGDGVTLFGNHDFNDQDPGDSDRARDQQIHCGPINATTDTTRTLYNGKPLWVNGENQEIGTQTLNERPAGSVGIGQSVNMSKLKCAKLLVENTWTSSIRVDGDYIAVLFKDDGRAEVFESPGDYRLRDNHIGNDEARYLLVLPIQK